jgi:hypothetical protein
MSEVSDSMRMWARYGDEHQGIVLRILPNLRKDSKFTQFRAVRYQEKRPPVYNDPISFLEGAFFADQNEQAKRLMNRVIYTKTLEWAYEREQRLAIPVLDERDWNIMP